MVNATRNTLQLCLALNIYVFPQSTTSIRAMDESWNGPSPIWTPTGINDYEPLWTMG